MNRTLGIATVAAAALFATTGPAIAVDSRFSPPVDHRPCVSKREFNGYSVSEQKAQLEARWEVTGLGRQRMVLGVQRAVVYPRCGYPKSKAWYAVAYTKDAHGRLWGDVAIQWHKPRHEAPAPPAPAPVPTGPPQIISARTVNADLSPTGR